MAKVLIVDDSETLRHQLKRDLEAAGHTVVEAVDGADGLEKFQGRQDLELILCDVNMPNMDGLTMVSKLAAALKAKNIPVFMLTTEASAEMKARAKESGVRAWITKPYIAEKLISAIQKVLSK
jgi:two-component system chemotaxis response regulator CheY